MRRFSMMALLFVVVLAGLSAVVFAQGYESEVDSDISVSGAPRAMTLCGFKYMADVSRVFVRTNDKVRYSVRKAGDRRVIIELQNTRIPIHNNERFLDTKHFNSPVKLIDPTSIEGGMPTARIEIELKRDVPYKAQQVENEIWVDFAN